MTDADLAAVAHHEAGHALAMVEHRINFRHASVVPLGDSWGRVEPIRLLGFDPTIADGPRQERRTLAVITVLLAGTAAEQKHRGRPRREMALDTPGSESDVEKATTLANSLCGHVDEGTALLEYGFERAKSLVELRWDSIAALAAALIAQREVSARRARRILDAAW